MLVFSSLLLSLALTASAAPQSVDNGSCKALQNICASHVSSDLSNAWNIKACIFGASCFGGAQNVDDFLAAVYTSKGGKGAAPKSANLPRVTSSLLNSISTDGSTISQQNFIDGYYSSLDETGGPYPTSSSIVIGYYKILATWTAFCTSNIPFRNFADYFQFSSTVSSPGCPSTTTSSVAPQPTLPIVSSDDTCQKMFQLCVLQTDSSVSNPWSIKPCVFGATCFGGQRPVAGFVSTVFGVKNPGKNAPSIESLPRLSTSLFNSVSTDGKTWTQQNFIDGYYGVLSEFKGPFPPNSSQVISYFNRVLSWTAFCPGQGIPYMNTADYFQFSSDVQGGTAKCN